MGIWAGTQTGSSSRLKIISAFAFSTYRIGALIAIRKYFITIHVAGAIIYTCGATTQAIYTGSESRIPIITI
jgi:hypothetical protein